MASSANPFNTPLATRITSLASALSCADDAETVAAALFAHANAKTHDKGPRWKALATAILDKVNRERDAQRFAVDVLTDLGQ